MEESAPPPERASQYDCPACGKAVAASDPSQSVLQCPDCGQQFFVPAPPDADSALNEEQDRDDDAAEEARREAELSELRISQVANLRRGAIRSRSWFIVGAVAGVVGAAQFIYFAIAKYRTGQRAGPLRDLLCAVVLLAIVPYFTRRIRQLGHEIAESRLKDPIAPPDFSTLSDGSQRWTNLDQLGHHDESERG
jgi:DNA-directed RNA polymerase subunit RPC12/RpoP